MTFTLFSRIQLISAGIGGDNLLTSLCPRLVHADRRDSSHERSCVYALFCQENQTIAEQA